MSDDLEDNPRWTHDGDMTSPSASRVYDAYLGGGKNFATDRLFAASIQSILPDVGELAIANRRFLTRAVEYAVGCGITQIIDIGAGIPSSGSTHLAAHRLNSTVRVLYADHEAVAIEALRASAGGDPRIGVVRADVRDVDQLLGDPVATALLDLSAPVVLVMGLLLHFIPNSDNPARLLDQYRQAVARGSVLVISHDTADGREPEMLRVAQAYADAGCPVVLRSHPELVALLDGWDLKEPGVVHAPLWRPNADDSSMSDPKSACVYAAVAVAP